MAPPTEVTVTRPAYQILALELAKEVAIRRGSGGIGKKMDSVNDAPARIRTAQPESAKLSIQSEIS